MKNSFFARSVRLFAVLWLGAAGMAAAQRPGPPQRPGVAPLIGETYPSDTDHDRVDDALTGRALKARLTRVSGATRLARAEAQRQLDTPVEVELVFKDQISARQMEDFSAAGGVITYMYRAVSFGWNGRIALDKALELPALLGAKLVLVQENRRAQLHMDTATRTGRVRPVWAPGFAGNPGGFSGSSNTTIAIVDSGVDETHTDLNGRRVYWKDFTTDAALNPIDVVQHGSHVAGIATGTGAAAGIGPGPLLFTDHGDLTGVTVGSFYPSPVELPAASVTLTVTATWIGGGSGTLHLVSHAKGDSTGYASEGSVTNVSPLTLTVTLTGDAAHTYSPALLSNGTMTDYVVKTVLTNYPGVGDGFNKMRGVAPGCNWAAAKVFNNAGVGSNLDVNAAVDDLVANRVAKNIKVMNLSLGTVGNPGIDATQRQKINTAVNNGIVVAVSAGNDGGSDEVDDPGRAAMALTVAASNDINQLTDYSSAGFRLSKSVAGQEEDYKPDLMAPGGSGSFYSAILSVDSNSADGSAFGDQQPNDYYNIQGTSMAAPFTAGCAALVIDALQQSGLTWDFASSQHSRYVKMLLCATASESNNTREGDPRSTNPTLQRAAASASLNFPAGKDPYEGYGMINPDAAIEAATLSYIPGATATATLGSSPGDRRVWARKVSLAASQKLTPTLSNPAAGDFDLYLYSTAPAPYGTPVLLASSTTAANGGNEIFTYQAASAGSVLLVVKRVSGSGSFTLTSPPPTLPAVTIASNNAFSSGAKTGNVITLGFTSNVSIKTPVVTMAGRTATVSGSASNWSATITVGSGDPEGVVVFSIAFQDLGSNPGVAVTATTDASAVIIDRNAPTLALPAPISVIASSAAGADVTYAASASDPGGSGVASSSFTPASGSTFAVGTTVVNAIATDYVGNTAVGSFNVTVTSPTTIEAWRLLYFGSSDNSGAGADSADWDGDGQSNLFEYVTGMIPTDASSRFGLRVETVEGQSGRKAVIFSPRLSDRSYLVRFKANLTDASWTTLTDMSISDNPPGRTVTDLSAGSGQRFYHVEITKP